MKLAVVDLSKGFNIRETYDVEMDEFGYVKSGFVGSSGASPCMLVVVHSPEHKAGCVAHIAPSRDKSYVLNRYQTVCLSVVEMIRTIAKNADHMNNSARFEIWLGAGFGYSNYSLNHDEFPDFLNYLIIYLSDIKSAFLEQHDFSIEFSIFDFRTTKESSKRFYCNVIQFNHHAGDIVYNANDGTVYVMSPRIVQIVKEKGLLTNKTVADEVFSISESIKFDPQGRRIKESIATNPSFKFRKEVSKNRSPKPSADFVSYLSNNGKCERCETTYTTNSIYYKNEQAKKLMEPEFFICTNPHCKSLMYFNPFSRMEYQRLCSA